MNSEAAVKRSMMISVRHRDRLVAERQESSVSSGNGLSCYR